MFFNPTFILNSIYGNGIASKDYIFLWFERIFYMQSIIS
ncbi:hypothetical protein LEP1GSC059_4417 [Leptospira noguchii serovar Panama str. CZ214]|uniref:Uncharacterized protein n=1 Tax=Leptospira noguchii serovar Panama str. CZ214 TaxID=1001595 RepID=T0FPC6_9LEPT|nr:hypothetical protein LEP1GSC059_4417 [Leptospira noguchii serovar Panama str. CZ214]